MGQYFCCTEKEFFYEAYKISFYLWCHHNLFLNLFIVPELFFFFFKIRFLMADTYFRYFFANSAFQNFSSFFTFFRPSVVRCPLDFYPLFSPLYDLLNHTNKIFSKNLSTLIKEAQWNNLCYIFGKVMVLGSQKQCLRVSDVQIHKYTNIQLHTYSFSKSWI